MCIVEFAYLVGKVYSYKARFSLSATTLVLFNVINDHL